MAIDTRHPQLVEVIPDYVKISDCLKGQRAIKNKTSEYLPPPEEGRVNTLRYRNYINRAQFVDYTHRELETLVGLAFSKEVIVELPPELEPLLENVNGNGLGLVQMAKKMMAYVLAFSRASLLVEYAQTTDTPTSVSQFQNGVLPTIKLGKPTSLINWFGQPQVHSVVFSEQFEVVQDFEVSYEERLKLFSLMQSDMINPNPDGGVAFTAYIETSKGWEVENEGLITTASGAALQRLPVLVAGAENNDYSVDRPRFIGKAEVNISHYQSSADNEEGVFKTGQATYVIANVDLDEMADRFPDGVRVGSNYVVTLPQGATASILQTAPNNAAQEQMRLKVDQLEALGAVRLDALGSAKTATEILFTETIRNGALRNAAKNVSDVITNALKLAAEYISINPALQEEIKFEIDVSAGIVGLDTALLASLSQLHSGGLLSLNEVRNVLKKAGLATEDGDNELLTPIEFEPPAQAAPQEEEEEETPEDQAVTDEL